MKRVMLITGASSGIGHALAEVASAAGYAIFAVGRNAGALAALERELRARGDAIVTRVADVSEPQQAREIVTSALAALGRIDVLVNNAGVVATGALIAQSDDANLRQFGTHVLGPLALAREALPALRDSRGAIFMVGSGVARIPIGGFGAYPPSKAALRSATRVLRRELQPLGVSVTYVDPGAVDTAFMTRAGMAKAPSVILAPPARVARAIFRGLVARPAELNAVPYQTAVVALAERFPRLTDVLLSKIPALVGGEIGPVAGAAVAPPKPAVAPSVTVKPVESAAAPAATAPATPALPATNGSRESLEAALEPLARRMERLKLSPQFVADQLVVGETLEIGDVAMRWAGMPNKNERSLTFEVFVALEQAGFVESTEDDRWKVLRAP